MHPDQKYLRELIENQLTVLSSKKRRCIWHPKVLDFATAIYTASLCESGGAVGANSC
jgi:hypothetical protein